MKKQSVTVLGGGTWGTAIAQLIACNGHEVNLWCKEPEVVHNINKTQVNHLYLPDFKLHPSIKATHDLVEAISGCSFIFEAVPVKFLRTIIEKIKKHIDKDVMWGILSKGIEHDTLMLPTQLINDVLGYEGLSNYNHLSVRAAATVILDRWLGLHPRTSSWGLKNDC